MSRLDSFIQRVTAQKALLDLAAARIADRPGPVLELGLGNGRTFDHLRSILPDREIFVFERRVDAHPDCRPDPEHLVEGDIPDSLPGARARLPGPAVLAHADLGTADPERNARLFARLGAPLADLLADGAVVVTDQELTHPLYLRLPMPKGVAAGRYHLYRYRRDARTPG